MLNENVIKDIRKQAEKFINEQNMENKVLRDEIFSLLQKQECVVLYYPVGNPMGERFCDGCNTTRTVNGKQVHMIFINTRNTVERQVFTAAHELGHILRIAERMADDGKIQRNCIEDATNRFAAELMMPLRSFTMQANRFLSEHQLNKKETMSIELFLRLVIWMMEYFFMPFKAVLWRFCEIGFIDEDTRVKIAVYKSSPEIDKIIKEEQYTRLRQVHERKSMSNISEYLQQAKQGGIFNETKIDNICRAFDIESILAADGLTQEIRIRGNKDGEKICSD